MNTQIEKTAEGKGLINTTLRNLKWPTSRPGPQATQPPLGTKPVPTRTDQVIEIDYNQERGEPGVRSLAQTVPDAS